MRIALLTYRPELRSSRRVVEAGESRGHEMIVVEPGRCGLGLDAERPRVFLGDSELRGIDAVVARISAASPAYGLAVVRQFEMQDIYCANGSQAAARARDKLRSLQLLLRKGIGIPKTAVADHPDDVGRLLAAVPGPPYIVKLVEGTQGVGVVKVDTEIAARTVVEALQGLKAKLLVQEFIAEAAGSDLRCFVVGDRVVAAMRRQGAEGDFRSNLHRGGSAEAADLSPEERRVAIAAAKAMGLRVAGVDLLRSDRGPLIMEVNASPGLEGIEAATGVDVASKIIQLLEKQAPRGHRGDRSTQH